MSTELKIALVPQRECVSAGEGKLPPYRLLVEMTPSTPPGEARGKLNLCVLLDCSGSMYQFQLSPRDLERWRAVAEKRGEMLQAMSDARRVFIWRGRTLAEMQAVLSKPMDSGVGALSAIVRTLPEEVHMGLVAFADRGQVIVPSEARLNPAQYIAALGRLREEVGKFRLGHGTFMSSGLTLAMGEVMHHHSLADINRIVLVSDGRVHDASKSLQMLDRLRDQGITVSTVGVGDEFDEEFLARVADLTGGFYYYAADPNEIGQRLWEEFVTLRSSVAYEVELKLTGLGGAEVTDLAQLRPVMSLFEEIWTGPNWMGVRLPQIFAGKGAVIAAEMELPAGEVGTRKLGEVRAKYRSPGTPGTAEAHQELYVEYTLSERRAGVTNRRVDEVFQRLEVYRREREAQYAAAEGDVSSATRKLTEAAAILTQLGDRQLAEDFRREAEEIAAGERRDKRRTKRIKARSRHLAGPVSEEEAAPSSAA